MSILSAIGNTSITRLQRIALARAGLSAKLERENPTGTIKNCFSSAAIARVIKEGKVRTYDMGGKNTTLEVAKEIAKYAG